MRNKSNQEYLDSRLHRSTITSYRDTDRTMKQKYEYPLETTSSAYSQYQAPLHAMKFSWQQPDYIETLPLEYHGPIPEGYKGIIPDTYEGDIPDWYVAPVAKATDLESGNFESKPKTMRPNDDPVVL